MVGQVQRRLLGLMAIGDQPRHEVNGEVPDTSVTSVLYLRYVLELVVYGLNDRTLSQQQLIGHHHQSILHVLSDSRNQFQALGKELLKELLGDIAFILLVRRSSFPFLVQYRLLVRHWSN